MLPVKNKNKTSKTFKENTYERDINNLLKSYKNKLKTNKSNIFLHEKVDKKPLIKEISTSQIKNSLNYKKDNSSISNITYYENVGRLVCKDCTNNDSKPFKNQYELNKIKNNEHLNTRIYKETNINKRKILKKDINDYLILNNKVKKEKQAKLNKEKNNETNVFFKFDNRKSYKNELKKGLENQIKEKSKTKLIEKQKQKEFCKTSIDLNGYKNHLIGNKNSYSKHLVNQIEEKKKKKLESKNLKLKQENEVVNHFKTLENNDILWKKNKKNNIKESLIEGLKTGYDNQNKKVQNKKKDIENNKNEFSEFKKKIENEKLEILKNKKLHGKKHINFIKSQILNKENKTEIKNSINKKYSCIDCRRKYPVRYLKKTKK